MTDEKKNIAATHAVMDKIEKPYNMTKEKFGYGHTKIFFRLENSQIPSSPIVFISGSEKFSSCSCLAILLFPALVQSALQD